MVPCCSPWPVFGWSSEVVVIQPLVQEGALLNGVLYDALSSLELGCDCLGREMVVVVA